MLTPKFDIDDSVYIIHKYNITEKITCPICNGKKIITYKKEIFSCPKCFDEGYLTKYKKMWDFSSTSRTIEAIVITKNEVVYKFNIDSAGPYSIAEKNCFYTLQEAQEECKNRNSLEKCK